MTFWFSLEAYGPESGTMSLVNGSHRLGVMGDYTTYGDGDAHTAFPEMQDLEMAEPLQSAVGDITDHTHHTNPDAGENRTERPRGAGRRVAQAEEGRRVRKRKE